MSCPRASVLGVRTRSSTSIEADKPVDSHGSRNIGKGQVNVTSYSAREFRTKALTKDDFLKDFVTGNEGDLDALVAKRRSSR